MSIQSEINRIRNNVSDTLDAFRDAGITVPTTANSDAMPSLVRQLAVNGGSEFISDAEPKDVNFWDYDGRCLYSYTLAGIQALTALPPLPSHAGLTCQGWNWDLADIKALGRGVEVGATYITDDGATRLYLSIPHDGAVVPINIAEWSSSYNLQFDWGDGSALETLAGSEYLTATHTYQGKGDYVVRLIRSGNFDYELSQSSVPLMGTGAAAAFLRKVEVGSGVSRLWHNAFKYCNHLESITIPNGVTAINESAFLHCHSLKALVFPKGFTSMSYASVSYAYGLKVASLPKSFTTFSGVQVFSRCGSLERVTLPNGITNLQMQTFESTNLNKLHIPSTVTTFGANICNAAMLVDVELPEGLTTLGTQMFKGCTALTVVKFPSTLATIPAEAFSGCTGMRCYDFTAHTSVPTLSNTNAFTSIPSDCQMLIPSALYDEWSTATNWATYASKMVSV